ncbi:SH3 domain-containing protein [Streptomyces scopuliridis]|uniref:SH3 domain-containing protein n=1 Tax=Streptomyces scopuliridis TaxID=452529 RepID=A0ACD5A263_9ACTN|nr:SH3 domain-containing protein [Streptomyces scopuliridis]WSC03322.1 SH3 domain-containing protein [Streptomyces scopuliridis]WSC10803.1 SH3 domain-containing protein [Streptomyces scopuliridis]
MLGALALPVLSATTASAAPVATVAPAARASSCSSLPPLPYEVHAKAVTIRSKATTKSTALGVLYPSHKFSVAKKSGNWLYITDKTTGVKGWVSGTYVYRDVRMCLD